METKIKSIDSYKGIGKKKAQLFKKIDIHNNLDLIYYFPREYRDLRKVHSIGDILKKPNFHSPVLIKARIIKKYKPQRPSKKSNIRISVSDKEGAIDIIFFNRPYLDMSLKKYGEYYFYGKLHDFGSYIVMSQPQIIEVESFKPEILPEYLLPKGISSKEVRKLNKNILQEDIEEILPSCLIEENSLYSLKKALGAIHFPIDRKSFLEAKRRLIYQELFFLELAFFMERNKNKFESKPILQNCNEFIEALTFQLTDSQKKSLCEILEDMKKNIPMNRLLQGDVGSGKTVVAASACFATVKGGLQASILAPTEILARQHLNTLKPIFSNFGYNVELLVGSMKAKEKSKLLERLRLGEIHLLIGTHAIIEKNVEFKNLALVVTDEQHRFGVNQRVAMKEKGLHPHTLVMTATPIPRTLGVIFYGDLDMSIIDTMPEGRKKIVSRIVKKDERISLYKKIISKIKKGDQGYIVAPLISDTENLDKVISVESLYVELKKLYEKKDIKIEILHGAMKSEEKDEIMKAFLDKEIDILISTVVIEVGINVPNATFMIVENAERFGLAQLHQLRGRIGRGSKESHCYFISDSKSENSVQRLKIMEESTDGFYIAEKDLELRGPGEIFGVRQHGSLDEKLRLAIKHMDILKKVKDDIKKYEEEIDKYDFYLAERYMNKYQGLNL